MKKVVLLVFILLSFAVIAQDNIIYEAEKSHIKIGKHKYILEYEYNYQPEGKFCSFSEVIIKDNRKQYLGHFIYQLKSNTEIQVSPNNPPPVQIENRIVQSSSTDFDIKKEQIIVTTHYYNELEPMEKEIKTLQQDKKGFFYTKEKTTYYKNGEIKKVVNFPQKIEFYKVPF